MALSQEEFENLYLQYKDAINRFFARKGLSNGQSEELAQDTFMNAFKHRHRIDESGFKPWLYTIAHNVYKNHLRLLNAQKRSSAVQSLHGQPEPQSEAPDPLHTLLNIEEIREVNTAFSSLPPGMQECLRLRVHHQLGYQEIADRLKTSLGNVKSQISTARKKLDQLLNPGRKGGSHE